MGNEREQFMENAGNVLFEVEESGKEMMNSNQIPANTESTPFPVSYTHLGQFLPIRQPVPPNCG